MSSTLIIILSHVICPSLCRYAWLSNKEDREQDRALVSIALVQCHAPALFAVMKFKTMEINFEGLFGLSTKISTHENYLPYCISYTVAMVLPQMPYRRTGFNCVV